MIIDVIAGEGYGPQEGEGAVVELIQVPRHGTRRGRLTFDVGGHADRCVYLGRDGLRELIVAAALALAECEA